MTECSVLNERVASYLFSYPGAVVRWMRLKVFGSEKTFKECLKQDIAQNAALGILLLVIVWIFSHPGFG